MIEMIQFKMLLHQNSNQIKLLKKIDKVVSLTHATSEWWNNNMAPKLWTRYLESKPASELKSNKPH